MGPPSGKVVQYGKRSSSKHRNSRSTSIEPSSKRQRLVDEEDEEISGHEKWRAQRPHDNLIQAATKALGPSTPNRTYNSKSSPKHDSPEVMLIPTRPNTPTRSPSPVAGVSIMRTPSKRPKDLSAIFSPLPQLSTCGSLSPGKLITKRMLTRSRTEPSSPQSSLPSFPSQPSPRPGLTPHLSLPNVSITPSQPTKQPLTPPSPSPVVSKPNFRTYSQSRSFLVALPADVAPYEIAAAATDIIGRDDDIRESYADLRTRWGVDHSEDDPYHVPGVTNDLMSVTELRSKGESRRFLDEVGYLFEGLEEPGMAPSVKRSSAAEIVFKMCDPEFLRKAKAADFVGHAWDALRLGGAGDGDKVLDPYMVSFVALVARDKRDIDDLSRKDGFFDVMVRLLQTRPEQDGLYPMEEIHSRKAGPTKTEWLALSNLRSAIQNKSDILIPPSTPSTRLLASYTLSHTTASLYPIELLPAVLTSLLSELALLRPRLDGYTSGLALFPSTTLDAPDLRHIDHCLIILDAYLLGSWVATLEQDHLNAQQEALCAGLVALCVVLASLCSDTERSHIALQCIESAFRVLVNLSLLSVEWCILLTTDHMFLSVLVRAVLFRTHKPAKQEQGENESVSVSESESDGSQVNDSNCQCLALALLSNVVLAVQEMKTSLRDISLDPSCSGGRCIISCRCSKRINAIECLVSFFNKTDPKQDSPSTPELHFFRCHLAALLCLLTLDDPINQDILRRALPGVDTRDKIAGLSHNIQLFAEFYTEAGGCAELTKGGSGVDMLKQVASALEALCV